MFDSILIVCVGNICRSPMAEALLRDALARAGRQVRVESAGLGALVDRPADPLAIECVAALGIDLTAHRARQLTPQMLRDFQLVLVMEAWQVKDVERLSPVARGKVYRLGHWGDFDIPDPYQRPRDAFERALARIQTGVAQLQKLLG